MSQVTITINSHGLINLAQCPRKYLLSEIFEKPQTDVMARGTLFAKYLEIYYKRKMKNKPTILHPFWTTVISKRLQCSREDAEHFWKVSNSYRKTYESEDWQPIAVEQGFSREFYEDSKIKIILEGRPDLIVRVNKELMVVDHKTQTQHRPLPEFNHQVLAYLFATGARKFCYNYIIFNKEPKFIRSIITMTDAEISYWRDNVIEMLLHAFSGKFLPNFNCTDIYGTCAFINVCKQPNPKYQEYLLNTMFSRKQERTKSWYSSVRSR